MRFANEEFILFLKKYQDFVNTVAQQKNYPANISHLLYLIVPAFIMKYGFDQEKFILEVFQNVTIIIRDRGDKVYQGAFSRILKPTENGYQTVKSIFLYDYEDISLIQLLDNLVHEFNHAVNSIKNEMYWDDKNVFLRAGLTYLVYDRATLQAIKKQEDVVLEEIINTRQTEEIIDLIASFSKYSLEDSEIINTLYAISQFTLTGYHSKAYYLQARVCQTLLKNKTFIHTLENLRFQGEISELDYWFDNIVGKKGSFCRLNKLLSETLMLEESFSRERWFKKRKLRKIQQRSDELFYIVEKFNQNCNFR